MKGHVKVTDEFIGHLPGPIQDALPNLLKEAEVEKPVMKRVPTVEPVHVAIDDNLPSATLYASTRRMDRDKEVILPNGMDLTQYNKAPVLLFAHQWSGMPIGSMDKTHSDGYGIRGVAKFASTQRGQEVWTLVKEGHLRTSSIGFIPTQVVEQGDPLFDKLLEHALMNWDEFRKEDARQVKRFITKGIMLENSIVPVPANPDALVQAIESKGFDPELVKMLGLAQPIEKTVEEPEEKAVIEITTADGTTARVWEDGCSDDGKADDEEEKPETVDELIEQLEEGEPEEKSVTPVVKVRVIKEPKEEPKVIKLPSAEDISRMVKDQIEISTGKI
jgi:phage head maturation protease